MHYFASGLTFCAICLAFFAGVEQRVGRSVFMVVFAGALAQVSLRLYGA